MAVENAVSSLPEANDPNALATQKGLVSIGKAAKILGVSIDTIRRWDKNGTLKSTRPDGKNRFFSIDDLEQLKFSQPLSISEVSEQLNISPSTLRRLEKKGLITPERTEKGDRTYDKKSLQSFLRTDYFFRQKEIEEEILKPLDGKVEETDKKKSSYHDPTAHAILGEHHVNIIDLKKFKKRFLAAIGIVMAAFAIVITILTLLFFIFPESTAKTLGYNKLDVKTKQFVFQAPKSLLARQLKPFSQTALRIVEATNPELRKKIAPLPVIEDVNDVFRPDSDGNVASVYTFTFPDTSYLKIPDTGLIENLNSQFVQGKKPGCEKGDLAIVGACAPSSIATTTAPSSRNGGTTTTIVQGTESSGGGTITEVIAGVGLSGGGSSGAVTLSVGVGEGLSAGSDEISIKLHSGGGLQTSASGISLDRSCANGEVLKWNGSSWVCGAAGISSNSFNDALFRIQDNADITKELAFEVSGITAGSTVTLTAPNYSGTIVATASSAVAGQVIVADATGKPQYVTLSGDAIINSSGVLTVANNAIGTAKVLDGAITNAKLDNSSLTVNVGDGLSGGGSIDLGNSGTIDLSLDTGSGLQKNASGLSLIKTCSSNQILKWSGSAWTCATDNTGAASNDFLDSAFRLQDNSDITKQIAFEASGITTGTTRTFTAPNVDGTLITTGNLTDITAVGTITSGVWNGSTIAVANGGTGATSLTSNGVLYGNGTGTLGATAAGINGQLFVGNTGSAPSFVALSGDATLTAGGTLTLANTAVTPGSYGSSTQVSTFTVDSKGRLIAAGNTTITGVTPGGSAGGDLSGTYPNPSVAKINGAILGGTTATAGNILIGDGASWNTTPISGDITISSTGVANIGPNAVALGTDTTGNYVASVTVGDGLAVSGVGSETSTANIVLDVTTTGTTVTTSSNSGLETDATGLRLLGGCTSGQILKWNGSAWACSADSSGSFNSFTVAGDSGIPETINDGNTLTIVGGNGLTSTISATDTLTLQIGAGNGISVATDSVSLALQANKGLEVDSNGLSLIDCATNQILKYNASNQWVCAADDNSSSNTFLDSAFRLQDNSDITKQIAFEASGITTGTTRTFTAPNVDGTLITTGNLTDITAVGTITSGVWNGSTIAVANGGTGATSLTSNGVLYGNGTGTLGATAAGINGQLFVGNTGSAPSFVALSGDATLTAGGALTIANDAITTPKILNGAVTNAKLANSSLTVTAGTGLTGGGAVSLGGSTTINLSNVGTAGTYGSASQTPVFTTDAQGRVTGVTNTSIALDAAAITSGTLGVTRGGTGAGTFTTNGVLFGNGTGAIQASAAGTSGQILVANGTGVPTFVGLSGDATLSSAGVLTIGADSVALGTDTTGNYVAEITGSTGIVISGSGSENAAVSLSLDVVTTGTTLTTATNSGLELGSDGIRLVGGCSSGQILKWNGSAWACANDVSTSGAGTLDVEEGDSIITAGATNLDFFASDFNITDSPAGEANVAIDYLNSKITRSNQNETIIGSWLFNDAGFTVQDNADNTKQIKFELSGIATGTVRTLTAPNVNGTLITTGNLTDITAVGTITSGVWNGSTIAVANGGTGATSLTTNGVLFGNGTGAISATSAGTSGQLLVANASGVPTFVTVSGDASIAASGTLTLANTTVTSGSYGSATQVPTFTVDSKGRLTAAGNTTITGTTPGGSAGGDLSGTYPNPTVARINGANLGTTTATSGNLLIGNGTSWVTQALSGDATIVAGGALTIANDAITTPKILNGAVTNAKLANSSLTVTAGTGLTGGGAVSLGGSTTINLSNVGTAGTYGSASQTPVFTTDAQGRVTGVTNTSIALDAAAITSGTLGVTRGGTGAGTFTTNGVLFGNGTGAISATSAGTSGQLLVANASGVPTFVTVSGDASIAASGTLTLANTTVTSGSYGSATQVPTFTVDSKGRLTAAGNTTITGTTPGGSAGGDLSGTYPNPTVARINGANLGTTTATSGNLLIGNGTSWVTQALSGDATIVAGGALTIANDAITTPKILNGAVTNAKLANSSLTVTAGTGLTGGGAVSLGGSTTINLSNVGTAGTYGSASQTPVFTTDAQGRVTGVTNTSIALDAAAITSGTLGVTRGGTGAGTFTTNGVLFGNGTGAISATSAGTSGQLLVANASGVPTFVTVSGDASIAASGTLTLANTTVTSGSYGSATQVPTFTVDSKGRLTAAGNTTITGTTPGGSAGGDLSGTYPNPTVARINGANLGTTTATSGNLLIGNGTSWVTQALSGDATIVAGGALTIANDAITTPKILNGAVTNAKLANSSLTVTAGTGLTGGGAVSLGGSTTINLSNVGTAGTYGSASQTPVFTTDAQGRVTGVTNTSIALDAAAITSGTLGVTRGGTGAGTFTTNGVLFGNGTGAISATSAGTSGQLLVANASGVPTFVTVSGDASIAASGTLTLANTTVTSGSYGSATQVPTFTVDSKGRLTAAGNTTIALDASAITSGMLGVTRGGTGAGTFTTNGLIYGNGTGALQSAAAGTSGQLLVANGTGIPTFVGLSGDATLSSSGVLSIAADSVALGTDTTGNYVAGITGGNGVSISGSGGEGSTPTVSVLLNSTGPGLELSGSGLSLLRSCANGQILKWNASITSWYCAADDSGGGGGSSALSGITAATSSNTINNGDNAQTWNWSLATGGITAFTFGENAASTNGSGSQYILSATTLGSSTAAPFNASARGNKIIDTTAAGGVTIGNITSAQAVNIDAGTGSLNLATSNNARTTNIGTGTAVDTINIGTGGTGADLISIGSSSNAWHITSGGAITTSGNFVQTGSSTLTTGTGNVSLNGTVTVAANKSLIVTGGAGDPTLANGTIWYDTASDKFKIVENGVSKVLCNATDAGCGAGGGGGSSVWSALTAPSANLSINHGEYTSQFTWDTSPTAAAFNGMTLAINNDATTDSTTQRALLLKNNNLAGGGTTENLLQLDNADADSTLGSGILITNSGGTGFISNAVDASATGIINALKIGANNIAGVDGTITINNSVSGLTNFAVNSTGTVTIGVGQSYTGINAVTLSSGGGNTLTLKSALATGLTIDSSNTALQAVGLNTINTSTSLSLNPNTGTSYTLNSTANTLALFDTPTTLNFAQGATTLNIATSGSLTRGINIGTGTGADTISIGTGGTVADSIIFGNTSVATTTQIRSGVTTGTTTNSAVSLIADSLSTGTGLYVQSNGTITNGGDLTKLVANNATTGNVLNVSANALTSGNALIVQSSSTNNFSNGLTRIVASANHTGTVLNVQTATTTGTGVSITDSAAGQTSSNLLNVAASGFTTGYTGNVVSFSSTSTTGSGNVLNVTSANTTAGNGINLTANSLAAGGTGLNVNSSSTGAFTSGLASINASAANTGIALLVNTGATAAGGTGVSITDSASAQVGNTLLNIAQTGVTTGYTGNAVNITSTSTTGSGTVLNVSSANTTAGTGIKLTSDSLQAGANGLLVQSSSAGNFTDGLVKINATGANTGTVLNVQTATTTGTGVSITDSAAGQTSSNLLNVAASGFTTGYTGNVVSFSSTSTTGSGNVLNVTSANTTAGNGINLTANSLAAGGTGLNVNSSSTGAFTSGLASINASAANTGIALLVNTGATAAGGTGVSITDSASAQVGNTLLNIAQTGVTTGYTGNAVNITSTSTTGSGSVVNIQANSLNGTGIGLNVNSSTSGALTSGLVSINASGTHTGTAFKLLSGSLTGTAQLIQATALTTGTGLQIAGGANLTSAGATVGSLLNISATTSSSPLGFAHTTSETGNVAGINFADNTSASGALTTTTNGLVLSSTVNITGSGTGTKTVNSQNINAPTISSCSATNACAWNGSQITTQTSANANLTQNAINIATTGTSSAGAINGINIGTITGGTATETAINIGRGWDNAINIDPSVAGTIIKASYATSATQTGALTGLALDFNTNFTGIQSSAGAITGVDVGFPGLAVSGSVTNYTGFNIGSATNITTNPGTVNWNGASFTMPNIFQTAGTINTNGVKLTTGTMTTGGTQNALLINAQGASAGTLTGLNISGITAGAGSETGIKIGAGWDTALDVSAAMGTAALSIGSNAINGTNFNVSTGGNITVVGGVGLDTIAAGTLIVGGVNATTLSVGVNNSGRIVNIGTGTGIDTINIGNGGTGADLISIGSSANNWNVTSGGSLTLGKASTTTGRITFGGSGSANTSAFELGASLDNSVVYKLPINTPTSTSFLSASALSGGVSQLTWTASTATLDTIGAAQATQVGGAINSQNFGQVWNWSTLTSQTALTLGSANTPAIGAANLTTGGLLAVGDSSTNYVHTTVNERGNAAKITFRDSSTNANNGGTTNGLDINSAFATTGAGTKLINAINVNAPSTFTCATGSCTWDGLKVATAASSSSTITQNGIEIAAGNITAGTQNGILIGGITQNASATETALKIGAGWDTDLSFLDLSAVISIANGDGNSLSFTDGTSALMSITDQTSGGDTYGVLNLNAKSDAAGNPASCAVGDIYVNSHASNKGVYACTETNTWEKLDNGNIEARSTTGATTALSAGNGTLLFSVSVTPTISGNEFVVTGHIKAQKATSATAAGELEGRIERNSSCSGTNIIAEGIQMHPVDATGTTRLTVAFTGIDTASTTAGTAVTYVLCGAQNSGAWTAHDYGFSVEEVQDGAGADIAEVYYSKEALISAGSILAIDDSLNAGVKKSTSAYQKGLLGIVTTDPGIVLSDKSNGPNPTIVALAGRVPVRVNNQNGPIRVGDRLTSSSTPGVAMKATKAGPSIGVAMTEYDGIGEGKVMTFVNSAWYSGSLDQLMPEGLATDGSALTGDEYNSLLLSRLVEQTKNINPEQVANLSDVFADRIVAGLEVITPKLIANNIQIKNQTGITTSTIDENGNAIFDGTIKAKDGEFGGSVSANAIDAKQTISAEIGQRYFTNDSSISSGDVVMLDPSAVTKVKKADSPYSGGLVGVVTTAPGILIDSEGNGASVIVAAAGRISVKVSTQNGKIEAGDMLTSSSISGVAMKATGTGAVIGRAIMAYSGEGVGTTLVLVNNGMTTKDLSPDLNALTSRLSDLEKQFQTSQPTTTGTQSNGKDIDLSNITVGALTVNLDLIVKGAMVVDGPATFKEAVRFEKDAIFDGNVSVNGTATFNKDTAGHAIIKTGENSIHVTFDQAYKHPPVITASVGNGQFVTYAVSNVTTSGFDLVLQVPASSDILLNWTAISVKDAQTAKNNP